LVNSVADLSDEDFYSRSLERIERIMVVLGALSLISCVTLVGWRSGLGFALGGAVAYVNFLWLKKIVAGVGELAVRGGNRVSKRGIVVRFLLRYVFMAVAAFVILNISRESLYGLFAGLLLPVSAILCEGAYEVVIRAIRG
jgi:hypothetical protein